jgi:hypothetical protein
MRVTNKADGTRIVALNLRMDLDAYLLLRQLSPGPRTLGRFLSRLVYQHQSRMEERERLREQLAAAIGPEVD